MGSSPCKAEHLRARHFICVQSSPLHFICPESRITARYPLCLPPFLHLPRPSLSQLLHIFMSPGLSALCSSSVTIIPPFLHSFMPSHIAHTQCIPPHGDHNPLMTAHLLASALLSWTGVSFSCCFSLGVLQSYPKAISFSLKLSHLQHINR